MLDLVSAKSLRGVGIKEFLFGDFDRDGVKNVDDPYPFDKSRKRYVNTKGFWNRAQYGDPMREVLLSRELRAIERDNNSVARAYKPFFKANPQVFYRVKTVPSTIKKLRGRFGSEIKDKVAGTYLTENRSQAKKVFNQFKRDYAFDSAETDDYYRQPKGGSYRAYHLGLINNNQPLELQIKSRKMYELALKQHLAYKKNAPLEKYRYASDVHYSQGY